MHFTTLFLMEDRELKNTSNALIEDLFRDNYCYCWGETNPTYRDWCDWFVIGGRWNDEAILKTKTGRIGEDGFGDYKERQIQVCEVKDLTEPLVTDYIYAVADEFGNLYESEEDGFGELIRKINSKQVKGVLAIIDCHD